MLFFVISCSSKHYDFARRNIGIQQPTLLITDGVYMHKYIIERENYYNFIRFFDNGRCYISHQLSGESSLDSICSFSSKGQKTYFRNKGNDLVIEKFDGGIYGYIYMFGKVDTAVYSEVLFRPKGLIGKSLDNFLKSNYMFMQIEFKNKSDW
jgi:hypothetical protein